VRIRTLEQLSDALSREIVWRKRELSILRFMVDSGATGRGEAGVILRAASAMLYAHWEGFIRAAGEMYVSFVSGQKISLDKLATNFVALSTRTLIRRAISSNKIRQHHDLVENLINGAHKEAELSASRSMETKSNLSSAVLAEIFATLGLDHSEFESKSAMIDEQLLERRNTVAHGEYLSIDKESYLSAHSGVVEMLERIRTLIENAAALKKYLREN
jgi:hypothetical protein